MRIHDLSVGISPSLPIWPGNPGIGIFRVQDIDSGPDQPSVIDCDLHKTVPSIAALPYPPAAATSLRPGYQLASGAAPTSAVNEWQRAE